MSHQTNNPQLVNQGHLPTLPPEIFLKIFEYVVQAEERW